MASGIAAAVGAVIAFPFFFVDFKNKQPHRPNPLAPAGQRSVRHELYAEENKNNLDNPFRVIDPELEKREQAERDIRK